jgi:hypothetical protein
MQCTVTYATGMYEYLSKINLRYKFLLDTYHPDTLYLHKQGCEDPWLFFKAKRGPQAKKFGKHSLKRQGDTVN